MDGAPVIGATVSSIATTGVGATVASGVAGADVPRVVVAGATVLGVSMVVLAGAPVIVTMVSSIVTGVGVSVMMVGIASSSLFVEGAGVSR